MVRILSPAHWRGDWVQSPDLRSKYHREKEIGGEEKLNISSTFLFFRAQSTCRRISGKRKLKKRACFSSRVPRARYLFNTGAEKFNQILRARWSEWAKMMKWCTYGVHHGSECAQFVTVCGVLEKSGTHFIFSEADYVGCEIDCVSVRRRGLENTRIIRWRDEGEAFRTHFHRRDVGTYKFPNEFRLRVVYEYM